MNFIKNKLKTGGLLLVSALIVLSACNKEVQQFGDIPVSLAPSNVRALADTLARIPSDTMFYKVVARAGAARLAQLNDKTKYFTIFAPDNNAIKTFISFASQGQIPVNAPDAVFVGFINNNLSSGAADTLVQYHIIPQAVPAAKIPTTFPNFPYPTLFNPATALSPFARMDAYISRRSNGAWKDNVPVIVPDILAANGVIHTIAAVTLPPSTLLWSRINTDPELTFLKAAILRADSGATASTVGSPQYYLGDQGISLGANFTLFAPTDQAFKNGLYVAAFPIVRGQIFAGAYAQAIAGGATVAQATTIANTAADANAPAQTTLLVASPTIFSNATLYPYLTAEKVKGILFYHLLGVRAFSVNLPTTPFAVPTLLNAVLSTHPGVTVGATFTGPVVTAATVKGLVNPTAATILINPTPVIGSSDQRYVNGVLHKIDQVLFPAPL